MSMLCLVDNALKSFVGHNFEYSRCLYECAAKRGAPILILGHRAPVEGITRYFPFERTFRRSHYDLITTVPVIRDLINPTVQNCLFFLDLRTALKKRCSPDWTVFTPAMNHNHIYGWAAWLQTVSPQECPAVILFLRNSYCFGPDPNRYDKRAYFTRPAFRWLERLAASGRRIHLVTDSERLSAEFSRLTRLPLAILPTPHTDRIGRPVANGTSVPRFTWLGGIRKDKGFLVFAGAVQLLEPELRGGCIEFVIQSNLDHPHDTEAAAARDRLKSAALPGVTLIEKTLSSEEYTDLLLSAGVVVIPRLLQLFRSQTSGPFVEALAAGKPVIVTEDSWMSDQLKRYGAGVTFTDQDAGSLAQAIRAVAADYEKLKTRAERSAGEWASIHNPESLYDMVQSLADG